MLPQKFDTTSAHKVINLMPELTGTDKRVAAAIIEHFNRQTAQWDPGLDRIAWLVGVSRRTAIRSVSHIVRAGVFRVVRHGGYSQRNSYEPVWLRFRELEAVWKIRFRAKSRRADGSKMAARKAASDTAAAERPVGQIPVIEVSKAYLAWCAHFRGRREVTPFVQAIMVDGKWCRGFYATTPFPPRDEIQNLDGAA